MPATLPMPDLSDLELLAELGVETEKSAPRAFSAREERIIAGFEDIQRFFAEHGRLPQHGEGRDIFERLYAVRLDQLRKQPDCRALLADFDADGLLDRMGGASETVSPDLDDAALLSALGVPADGASDVTQLKHVMSAEERQAAEEIANRERCPDFERFAPLFKAAERDLESGVRVTRPFVKDSGFLKSDIVAGQFFIVGGQIAYVASVGDTVKAPNGEFDARLRVIYANGTESNLLRRSLQRALYKDEGGRRITDPEAGPLFGQSAEPDDLASGNIYVLRSQSDHPFIREHRDVVHKIGVTGQSVESRIANAASDATFLLADVEIAATYKLYNINRTKLENLIHRVLTPARLDLAADDRFGKAVQPREWFLVPLPVINELVSKIGDGSITNCIYDPTTASLIEIQE